MRIAFVGNFSVPYSTESHHAWTWQRLGHEVVKLQENQVSPDQVVEACRGCQIFQYTHTHGWGSPDFDTLNRMLDQIHAMGVKSFSYHLDVYFGLNTWDRRDELVGKHPSWRVQHFFSTVGSKDALFKQRGVNHHYLSPAVVEYGCFEGSAQSGLACDVGFAGSVNYHPEYPFRAQMIKALQDHYGPRFRVFQGVREKALNDLYASVKVLVGDHCFAGEPLYWSDRLPETCGRGGFIIYPKTEGMCVPVVTYRPQDANDLIKYVDHYLQEDCARESFRAACFDHVKRHDTYTHRLCQILRVMGLEDQHLRSDNGQVAGGGISPVLAQPVNARS